LRHLGSVIPVTHVLYEDAIEDVMLLFDMLRYIYAGYNYLGGDAVFTPIRDSIIASISEQDVWHRGALENLLFNSLNAVIHDNNASIAGRRLSAYSRFFTYDGVFLKTENGFLHYSTGRYVTDVVGYNINDVFRLALGQCGNFYYRLVIYQLGTTALTCHANIIFNTGETEAITLVADCLRRRIETHVQAEPSVQYQDDIPVVRIENFLLYPVFIQRTLIALEQLRHEPIIVIDIRNSLGFGDRTQPVRLMYSLMGEVVLPSFVHFQRQLAGDVLLPSDNVVHTAEVAAILDFINEIMPTRQLNANYTVTTASGGMVSNDRLVILLVCGSVAVPAEDFVNMMLSIENTLIIGQNTHGASFSSFGERIHLPNSGIRSTFGQALVVHSYGQFTEGVGIAPDVWVTGCALTATLNMLNLNR